MAGTLAGTNLVSNLPPVPAAAELDVPVEQLSLDQPQIEPAPLAEPEPPPPPETNEEEIATFRMLFGDLPQEQGQQQVVPPPEQRSTTTAEDYRHGDLTFSEPEFDAAMKDAHGFNKAMQTAYVKTVTDAVQTAVSYMNNVMENRLRAQEIVNEFYAQYSDLRNHKHIVKAALEEVGRVMPQADLATRLVKAASAARAYVGNKTGNKPAGVLKTTNSRPPAQAAPKSRQEQLIGAFLKSHIGG